jgi:histidinol dehydrogenase
MLRRIDLRGRTPGTIEIRSLLPRAPVQVESALASVGPICDDVRARGALAVREITKRFDGVDLATLRVPQDALATALADLDGSVRAALVEAARRARLVHEAQLHADVDIEVAPGGRVRERWVPVRRVGLYVPGGLVAYPSSVVMNVVPAQVAGVESLAVASPPQKAYGGLPHPAVLAACALLGVDEVYAVGGAQAIALFAYGSTHENGEAIEPVDVVTGPGNVYVAAAKRLVKGVVGIDSEAGPTEIGILADDSANPSYLAADLIAQAEHDELASCLLVTDSAELLERVDAELDVQVPATRHVERVRAALAGQSAYVLVDDVEAGLQVVDAWAAEHLEVVTRDAVKVADRVRNAGAIFVGTWSPVSLGDYLAGSNHVLPTGGTARFTGGLSVQAFQRMIHVIDYDRDALAEVAPLIDALGGAEDLAAHVAAVRIRVPRAGSQ